MAEKLKIYRIIGKVVFSLILISGLCSCGGVRKEKSAFYPWDEKKEQILVWATSEKNKVDKGLLKNSEYWKQFYKKSIELRPDLDDFLYFALEMIKVSRIFEEGKITKEQFEEKHRHLTALLAREEKRRAVILASPGIYIYGTYERTLFTSYHGSLFLRYVNDLKRQLNAAGPQYSSSRCAFFGDSIQCTAKNPPF